MPLLKVVGMTAHP